MITEVVAPHGGRLDAVLAEALPDLSRSRIARWVRDGRVQIGGAVVRRPASQVTEGAVVTIDVPDSKPSEAVAQDLPVCIVFEDAHMAVVDKAAGMVVHPGAGHPDGTLVNALLHHLDGLSGIGGVQRPGIVHRLDRGTSGLLVVAKHDAAHQALAEQFAAHTAGRRYLAVCHGSPVEDGGTLTSWLARHPRDRLRWATTTVEGQGRRAVTHWSVRARAGTICLIECRLETGRTHQVRVHLCEQGWPIVGDGLYRRRGMGLPSRLRGVAQLDGSRPLLHAWRLHLTHPHTREPMHFEATPPADMLAVLAALEIEVPGDSTL